MNEEEKRILENIKYKHECEYVSEADDEFLFNLIENQQKEIKELKESMHKERELVYAQTSYEINEMWKQKIKDKIEEYRTTGTNVCIIANALQQLLEEE